MCTSESTFDKCADPFLCDYTSTDTQKLIKAFKHKNTHTVKIDHLDDTSIRNLCTILLAMGKLKRRIIYNVLSNSCNTEVL